jgi:Flp pilus assembly protein TadB
MSDLAVPEADVPAEQTRPSNETSHPAVLIPEVPMLSKQTSSSPLSYIGSFRRTTASVRRFGTNVPKAIVAWILAIVWIALIWSFVTVWYFFTLIIFGWLFFPFRLIRRSHRKQERLQKAQLATMQAMMIQQQQVLAANPPAAPPQNQ